MLRERDSGETWRDSLNKGVVVKETDQSSCNKHSLSVASDLAIRNSSSPKPMELDAFDSKFLRSISREMLELWQGAQGCGMSRERERHGNRRGCGGMHEGSSKDQKGDSKGNTGKHGKGCKGKKG